jgi:hypothetical protein
MKRLTLYLGSTETDVNVRQMLETWSGRHPRVTLEYESIHENPEAAVRLGITRLPALVSDDELIVQGVPDQWLLPLLDRLLDQGGFQDKPPDLE